MENKNPPFIKKYINKVSKLLLVCCLLLTNGILDSFVIMAAKTETVVEQSGEGADLSTDSLGPTIENLATLNVNEEITESAIDADEETTEESTALEDDGAVEENYNDSVTYATGDFDIRLLEIQPSNLFTLGGGSTGSVIKDVKVNDKTYKVLVEKVSMPEFIGKIEQINGYYDIVVIGRNKSRLNGRIARDYSGINLGESEYNEGQGSIASGNNNMLPNENYVENDITIKKAKELVDFIESGQLFVINTDVFNIPNVENSNLFKYFNVYKTSSLSNVLNVSTEDNLKLDTIIKKYLESSIKKKTKFSVISSPKSDSNQASVGLIENRQLKFNLDISESSQPVSIKLYLDMNGDGLFQEKEVYKTASDIPSQQNYELIYDIGTTFFGWIDWKIEVQIGKVKSYELGHVYLKTLVKNYKKEIRVLQIIPNNNSKLDLETNEAFLNQTQNIDYSITIKSITASDFSKTAGKTLHLNGKYDMIIIGFADGYGSSDITGDTALNELESFIESGQSVMFTHDTMALRMESQGSASIQLTKRFRDIVGQSRFLDKFYDRAVEDTDESYIYTLDAYKVYNSTQQLYVGRNIPHINLGDRNRVIVGHALHGKAQTKNTSTVYRTNLGLITNYPYNLTGQSTISVADTHNQWYQLNLEDPDLVPWFNLSSNELNDFDSRNNYYTYSKGNITYSGTGHTNDISKYTTDEFQLFVNTIVKAERGANHAPVITSSLGAANSTTPIAGGQPAKFKVTVNDQDGDPSYVTVTAKVNGQQKVLISSVKYSQGELIDVEVPANLVGDANKIEILVEARDIQNAKAEDKIYYLQASRKPQINVTDVVLNGLVGDSLVADVRYEKLFDTSNQISDIKFELTKFNENLMSVIDSSDKEGVKSYIINAKTTLTNEPIVGKVTYKVGHEINETYFRIYINIRAAEVKLKVVDSEGTLLNFIDVYAKLTGSEAVKVDSGVYTFTGSHNIRIISDVTHEVSLSLPTNYELIESVVKEFDVNGAQVGDTYSGMNFTVSYDKPNVEITAKLRTDLLGEVRILEIEPADKFVLFKEEGKDVTGTEIIYESISGLEEKLRIVVDHITMPEFIGSVEKLNGKYDVITIGRNVHDWRESDVKNQSLYADYNFDTLTNETDILKMENDITNRKAEEIINFINSGQLVYLDKNIFNEDMKDTKLYRNFAEVTGTNLITSKSITEISINEIIDYYTNSVLAQQKQLQLQVIDATPSDITSNNLDVTDGVEANRNRKMYIQALSNDSNQENYSVKLYLDLDGDGLFSDDEIVVTKTGLTTSEQFLEIDYNIHPDFIGLLEWKLEVSKGNVNNPIKSYLTGAMNFHRLPGQDKKQIRVLQISNNENFMYATDEGTKSKPYDTLDLSYNKYFQGLLDSKELKDYNFLITIISVDAYNKILNDEELPTWYPEKYQLSENEKLGIKELNGYYDMIILGFADNYGDKISQLGLDNIVSFLETGQGLMLTHDTLTYTNGKVEDSSTKILNTFRGLVGQSRYTGPLQDLNGNQILYDPDQIELTGNEDDKALDVLKYSGATWAAIKNQQQGQSGNLATLSTEVYETNSALITSYPFNLVPIGESTIPIRRTHGQYLQLNLEDEAVIPWYTYTEVNDSTRNDGGEENGVRPYSNINDVNPYDVRNNYYTYSRKNITFSGTGEEKRERSRYPDEELKLFINTIIKAERGSNHAPTVEVQNLYEDMLVSKYQKNLNFIVIPSDMDLDKMKLTITVEGCSNNSCNELNNISVTDPDYIRVNGESVNISLNINNQISQYSQLKIKVMATDKPGANSELLVYTVNLTEDKLVTFNSSVGNYLIGDTATVSVDAKSNGTAVFNGNYELNSVPSQLSLVGNKLVEFTMNRTESKIIPFKFSILDDSNIQVANATNLQIPANYSYCLGVNTLTCATITGDYASFINVKRGRITLNFESNVTGLFSSHEIKVQLLKDDEIIDEKSIGASNDVIFDTVPTGSYSIKFILPESLSSEDYHVYKDSNVISWDKTYPVDVNYTNNHAVEKFNIDEVAFDVVHGIFEKQTDKEIKITESTTSNLTTVKGNTLVNFGATFTTKRNIYEATLRVSSELIDFNENSIRVFNVIEDNGSMTLVPIARVSVEKQTDNNQYVIQLPTDLEVGTKILVFYTGLVPNEDVSLLTNTIMVGATFKDVSIGVSKDSNVTTPEPNSYLPNLF